MIRCIGVFGKRSDDKIKDTRLQVIIFADYVDNKISSHLFAIERHRSKYFPAGMPEAQRTKTQHSVYFGG